MTGSFAIQVFQYFLAKIKNYLDWNQITVFNFDAR